MFRQLREDMAQLKSMVSSINTALIVREPGTARSAEAYEGLRRQVAASSTERRHHLIELVRILEALGNGVTGEQLQSLVESWAHQAGLSRWYQEEPADYFEYIEDPGQPSGVVHPAWVAGDPPVLIKPGLIRRPNAATDGSTSRTDVMRAATPGEDGR